MAQRTLFDKKTLANLKKHPLYSQDGKGDDAIVSARIFNPYGRGYWNITEWDGDDTMYGYYQANGHSLDPDADEANRENEYGYFSKSELENARVNVMGVKLPLERDAYFQPKRLGDIIGRRSRVEQPSVNSNFSSERENIEGSEKSGNTP